MGLIDISPSRSCLCQNELLLHTRNYTENKYYRSKIIDLRSRIQNNRVCTALYVILHAVLKLDLIGIKLNQNIQKNDVGNKLQYPMGS